jgi:glucose dehydrogenase
MLSLRRMVTSERLLHAADEPGNWMDVRRSYWNQRYSTLKQITNGQCEPHDPRMIFQTGIAKLGSSRTPQSWSTVRCT